MKKNKLLVCDRQDACTTYINSIHLGYHYYIGDRIGNVKMNLNEYAHLFEEMGSQCYVVEEMLPDENKDHF